VQCSDNTPYFNHGFHDFRIVEFSRFFEFSGQFSVCITFKHIQTYFPFVLFYVYASYDFNENSNVCYDVIINGDVYDDHDAFHSQRPHLLD